MERTVTRRRKWNVWTGSLAELNRIAAELESQAKARREAALTAFDEQHPIMNHPAGGVSSSAIVVDEERRRLGNGYLPTAEIDYGDEVVTGSYDEVMESFDRRTYSEIRLAMRAKSFVGQDTLKLDLRRYQGTVPDPAESFGDVLFPFGAYLVIKSTDPNWAMQAFAQLSNEVDKGQPWWRWIHTIAGSFMLCIAIGAALALSLYPLFAIGSNHKDAFVLAFGAGFAAFLLSYVFRLAPRLFPPVEILAEGSAATGTRAIISSSASF